MAVSDDEAPGKTRDYYCESESSDEERSPSSESELLVAVRKRKIEASCYV